MIGAACIGFAIGVVTTLWLIQPFAHWLGQRAYERRDREHIEELRELLAEQHARFLERKAAREEADRAALRP